MSHDPQFWKFDTEKQVKTVMGALLSQEEPEFIEYALEECKRVGWKRLVRVDLISCRDKLKKNYQTK